MQVFPKGTDQGVQDDFCRKTNAFPIAKQKASPRRVRPVHRRCAKIRIAGLKSRAYSGQIMPAAETISVAEPSLRRQARDLLTLGIPLVGSQLAQIAIHTTDTLMLGWYDVTALAAVSLAGPVFFAVFILGAGFAWAVLPMVASAAGTDDDKQVRRTTRMGLWLSIAYGIVFTLPLMLFEPFFLAIGQDPEVSRIAGEYMQVYGLGLLPALLIMVLRSYLSALEHTRVVLWMTVAMAVVNAISNYIFIFGNFGAPELGVFGAAISSLVSNTLGLAILVVYTQLRTAQYTVFQNFQRPDWDGLKSVFQLGWPIGLTHLSEVGLFAVASIFMGWVGTIPLAAHGIALQVASITFMVHLGLSQAITVRAGQAWGRHDTELLTAASKAALLLSGLAVAGTIALFLLLPETLVGLFVDINDPDRAAILAAGATLLAVAALFQLVDAAQVMALGMLRGVQDTRIPMIYAAISYWVVGIPVSYLLGFVLGWGGVGVWLGLVVGLAVAAVLLQHRFWIRQVPALAGQSA